MTNPTNEILYVVTSIYNPDNIEIRYKLYWDFKKYIEFFPNVILVTIELAFGSMPFIVTNSDNSFNIQRRTTDVLWYKENTLNIAFKTLPKNAKVAWIDADIAFENVNWVQDTLQLLDKYKFVQMLDACDHLGPNGEVLQYDRSFVYNWIHNLATEKKRGRSGLAWASTIETLEKIGYLIDWDIVGASDWSQVFALTNQTLSSNPSCKKKNDRYSVLVKQHVDGNVGYVDGKVFHFFHGYPKDRGYGIRDRVMTDNAYDPDVNIGYRADGLIYFTTDKPKMRQQLVDYFRSTKMHGPGESRPTNP